MRKLFKGQELLAGHSLPMDIKQTLGEVNFKSFFKFTIIRNPFDFMVSVFFYGKAYKNHFMHNAIVSNNMTMNEFIPYYMEVRAAHKKLEIALFGSNRVVTFKDWLLDDEGNEVMDYVCKLENIKSDLAVIFKRLDMPERLLPVVNTNPHRVKNYRRYYNMQSIQMIEKYFAWELEKYKYKFE